ncbi:LLM class F420-dependent oxidoreductase [Actinomarinicola tropica]|uniref:LLM class F420-dependent oxidoreductase n=1 Tax=Actinomarinicola tropica TaxID=2789776 RepID=A0A5Q2RI73_9ACTN|nr:LLM class F420-dependent oxidoreductase [Actinomarinicola tropica]QGG93697.1 LLM class F420-dependent oxidoreductase [Actinomarinicola tropica]
MKLSMSMSYAGGFLAAVEQVQAYEKAGVDMVWVAEAYGNDAPTLMGYIAAKTERIEIASGILPIYTRTPTLLAMTAAGLDEISGGRAVLGLGASGPQVIEGFHGIPYDRPLQRTREIIDICRMVWRRERLEYDGKAYHLPLPEGQGTGLGKALKIITHPQRADIPIYVASLGPKNVQMTAELADGWLPIFYNPHKANDVWGDDLAAGFAKRSSDLGPLQIVAGGAIGFGDEETAKKVRDANRPMVALYVGGMGARDKNFYNDLFCRYGYEAEAKEIQDLYLSGKKDEAAAAIPDDFLRASSLFGDEGFVREQVQAYKDAGVTALSVAPIGDDPIGVLEKVKAWAD